MENNKLDPAFKEKWVEALESGNYVQGKGCLTKYCVSRDAWSYCCLGVAGCLLGAGASNLSPYAFLNEDCFDSPKTFEDVGFTGPVQEFFSRLNDGFLAEFVALDRLGDDLEKKLLEVDPTGRKMTFEEIAQVVKDHF